MSPAYVGIHIYTYMYTLGRKDQSTSLCTGDSACRIRRYWCSFVLNCVSNLSVCDTFLMSLLPPPNICGLLPNPERPTI